MKSIVLRVKDSSTGRYTRILFNTPKEAKLYASQYLTAHEDNSINIECYFRRTNLNTSNTLIFTINKQNGTVNYAHYNALAKRRIKKAKRHTALKAAYA